MIRLFLAVALSILAGIASAQSIAPREGWVIIPTSKSYADLVEAVKTGAKANKLGVVTQAGPTGAAKQRGIEIPGNRVIGLFNNVYAVRILGLSTAAMIEAPIRMYVTEEEDGTATLSYKEPSFVFAPYMAEGGADLETAAAELDVMFAAVAEAAAN
ncbi:MAG: DUF302 domain-containing protein [Pseudomonadota bacterium]